jgi:hypothetical protein
MIRYIGWLAHEMLPVIDDSNEANPEALGLLRTSLKEKYRRERMELVLTAPIDTNRDCNALLKKFQNKKLESLYVYFSRCVIDVL